MTVNAASVSVLALTGCLLGLGFLAATGRARAQAVEASGVAPAVPEKDAGTNAQRLDFDIPAQPLEAALSQYGAATRQPVIYPSRMAAGRMSSAVQGRHAPEAALQRLLAGTGLWAERIRTDAGDTFTLSELAGQAEAAPAAAAALQGETRTYAGQLQARMLRALCADPETAPGNYAVLTRFQLDADGRIQGVQLLDSTGEPRRDRAILKALRQLRMAGPPPRALSAQPLTVALLPRDPEAAPQCRPGEGGG
jgi:TonB family protein